MVHLDISKNVFLAPSCLKDQKTIDHVLKLLEGNNMPKNKIIKGINMDILNSGDYLSVVLRESYSYGKHN